MTKEKQKLPFDPFSLKGYSTLITRPSKTSSYGYKPIGKATPEMIRKEMKEHKWASYRTAQRIAQDHMRAKKKG